MPTCQAIKSDGEMCGKRVTANNEVRCTTHMKTLQTNGPHTQARKELAYVHRARMKALLKEWHEAVPQNINAHQLNVIREEYQHRIDLLKLQQRHEMNVLSNNQRNEIIGLGFNPDEEAANRREVARHARRQDARLAWEQQVQQVQHRNQANVHIGGGAGQNNRVAVQDRALAEFVNDNQNVHTTVAVKQTKDIVERILKIPVPDGYKWNTNDCSKTIGEIITECNLTPKGTWQMTAKYCQDESIYDFEKGIYGKVLDGVWQYISKSPDKKDLCIILKQEMEDNIGMCAQGNLTRICNILSGYMEGIGVQESPAEVLGRKLPLIMEIDDQDERLKQAYDLLNELKIPVDNWLSWVAPLVDEGIVNLDSTGAGQVIGFKVVSCT